MNIRVEQLALELSNPFKISHGTSTVRENLLVHLSDGEYTGVGEAAIVPYYDETAADVHRLLSQPELPAVLGENLLWLEDALASIADFGSVVGRAALDVALHDLWGQRLGQPLYRLWGLNPARSPVSTYTLAMPEVETIYRERLHDLADYPLIKLKLGTGDAQQDVDLVRIAREEITQPIAIDANGAWTPEDALMIIPQLAQYDVIFIEQPVAKTDFDGWALLQQHLPEDRPPLIADESVQGIETIPQLAGLVDGINIKLAKCGGLRAARQMIVLARTYGMRVMLGCMVESSVAVTAAAHLAPLADYADLDGFLLIKNDPYSGVQMANGRLILPDAPGLGVQRQNRQAPG